MAEMEFKRANKEGNDVEVEDRKVIAILSANPFSALELVISFSFDERN